MTDWIEDDYPTRAALKKIRNWELKDQPHLDVLWKFVRHLWIYPDRFVPSAELDYPPEVREFIGQDVDWYVSTGGWSGHEDVIGALQQNLMFWSLCWRMSRAGGHFWFRIGERIK